MYLHHEKAGQEEQHADRGHVDVTLAYPTIANSGRHKEGHEDYSALQAHLCGCEATGQNVDQK